MIDGDETRSRVRPGGEGGNQYANATAESLSINLFRRLALKLVAYAVYVHCRVQVEGCEKDAGE